MYTRVRCRGFCCYEPKEVRFLVAWLAPRGVVNETVRYYFIITRDENINRKVSRGVYLRRYSLRNHTKTQSLTTSVHVCARKKKASKESERRCEISGFVYEPKEVLSCLARFGE